MKVILRKLLGKRHEATIANEIRTNLINEIKVLKELRHPNIVQLKEVIDDEQSKYLYMVMEYLPGQNV